MKNGSKLFQILLQASEKAANVARACRENELFPYLIEEKSLEEKNPRFFHDFKTLADVLIQEIIKHDIGVEVSARLFSIIQYYIISFVSIDYQIYCH